ncbi:MAG TPA: chemotaxis protein CheB [Longimicrobium sp.]|uniref:chemotaxis protein CheB n=1 Tax=Longimicrobium sp. TaxID=2029185 RepID=UPI002EDAFB58
MEERDIVVIGASAGGVEAVASLIEALPRDLAAAVFVVVHFPPHTTSVLPRIITRRGGMTAMHPEDGTPIELGCVYVAPPDRHLLVENGFVRLIRGPRENSARPAVDPLFRSAARAYGSRVIGIVLTGNLDDGTAGLMAVRSAGGLAIIQDPDDALYAGMPSSALRHVQADHVAPLSEIPTLLVRRVGERVEQKGAGPVARQQNDEVGISEMYRDALESPRAGVPSGYACPECHGALWETDEGGLLRFRCRVGHAYSIENLLAGQGASMDAALWAAYRALEERAALTSRMGARMRERGQESLAQRYAEQTEETLQRAELIRRVLLMSTQEVPVLEDGPQGQNVAD